MKVFAPYYYKDFACTMSACRHNCCRAGWEIDIDRATLAYYRSVKGALGEKLKAGIINGEEGSWFRMNENGACPFVNEKGLCELILELGENSLCQICRDHPRFRSFFSDHTEIGVGLCCEEAARLILSQKEPFAMIQVGKEDAGEEELSDAEELLLDFRKEVMSHIFAENGCSGPESGLAQDGCSGPESRLTQNGCFDPESCFAAEELPADVWERNLKALAQAEILEEKWKELLLQLLGEIEAAPDREAAEHLYDSEWKPRSRSFDQAFRQLAAYLVFRHFPEVLDEDFTDYEEFVSAVRKKMAELRFELVLIRLLFLMTVRDRCCSPEEEFCGLIEICRLFSSEVEYSEENLIDPALS